MSANVGHKLGIDRRIRGVDKAPFAINVDQSYLFEIFPQILLKVLRHYVNMTANHNFLRGRNMTDGE
jgi:hypothetical protein